MILSYRVLKKGKKYCAQRKRQLWRLEWWTNLTKRIWDRDMYEDRVWWDTWREAQDLINEDRERRLQRIAPEKVVHESASNA